MDVPGINLSDYSVVAYDVVEEEAEFNRDKTIYNIRLVCEGDFTGFPLANQLHAI